MYSAVEELEKYEGRKFVSLVRGGLVFFFPWDYFPLTVCFSKCLS